MADIKTDNRIVTISWDTFFHIRWMAGCYAGRLQREADDNDERRDKREAKMASFWLEQLRAEIEGIKPIFVEEEDLGRDTPLPIVRGWAIDLDGRELRNWSYKNGL